MSSSLQYRCVLQRIVFFLLPETETKQGSVYKRLWPSVRTDSSVFFGDIPLVTERWIVEAWARSGQPVPGNGSCQTRGIPAKNTRSPRRAGGVGSLVSDSNTCAYSSEEEYELEKPAKHWMIATENPEYFSCKFTCEKSNYIQHNLV